MRIDVRVQYLIVHRAFLVIAIASGPLFCFGAFSFGCGGQLLGDNEGTDTSGTIDTDSGVVPPDSGNNVVAKGKCPRGLAGPALIPLEENGGIPYCIDSTEVTNAQYAQFLATNPQPQTGTPGPCFSETSLTPEFGWPAAASDSEKPVVNVDWCDAKAYCAWAGKKLCGAPGGVTGSVLDDRDPDTSLWYSACSNLGADDFSYGNTYQGKTCNGADDQIGETVDVDSPATCTNSVSSQVFDMSGNVWEWEDACEDETPTGRCRLRGGSFRSNADSLDCAAADLTARNSKFDDFGFRCCAE